ncbi:hypothetical protein [Rhodopirellula bahusiensis]|uniref:hypothetical protein n=1 Tax=Rhodopirellula bahusiensis TaxID=2014065 RepID=UPI003264196A
MSIPTSQEIERLIRRIAPADLGSRPIYVCFASMMPERFKPSKSVWGYHANGLDLAMREWLIDSDRWRGRGPAVVINDTAMIADGQALAPDDAGFAAELARERIIATACHESAHALSAKIDFRPLPSEITDVVQVEASEKVAKWVAVDGQPTDEPPPWMGHELQFIRVLTHVICRAERILCERVWDSLAFASRNYEVSRLGVYRRALQREIDSFDKSVTFADLQACQPPAEFVERWKKDLHRWWSDSQSEHGVMAIAAAMRPYVHTARSK